MVERPEARSQLRFGIGAGLVERWIARTFLAVAVAFLAVAAVLTATLPYHGWDAFAFGEWSRLIGLNGGFHFPQVGPSGLHRPLFYVLQGEVWRIFGYHMALGRFLSLGFAIVLVAAIGWVAARPTHRALRASVAVMVALIVPDIASHASDGLTDVPAAAMVALIAVVLWTVPDSRLRPVLLATVALLAVLAKPSGIVGVGALLLAQLVGDRPTLRRRIERDCLPIAFGLTAGLVYDWTQAIHAHTGLSSFLQAGVSGSFWADRAAAARGDAIYGWRWLGDPLHVVLAYAVAYALLRVGGARHRLAAAIALPAGWTWAWLAPSIADHPFRPGTDWVGIATYVVAASLVLVIAAPEQDAPARIDLLRLLIWATPAVIVWIHYAAYDTRLLSAAWPPLILLMGTVVTMVILGAAHRAPLLAAIPAAALLALLLSNVYSLDGLGHDGWRQYRAGGLSGLRNPRLMENIALGQFQEELDAVRGLAGPGDRVVGGDGRLGFFFPGRVGYYYPTSCEALTGYSVFVLLMSDESVEQALAAGAPATESDWAACRSPHLTLVASLQTASVFRVD